VVLLPKRQKLSARETVAEIGRLCDRYGFERNEAGTLDALFLAVQEGVIRIPARKPGRPKEYGAAPIIAMAEGRASGMPSRSEEELREEFLSKSRQEFSSALKLLADIEARRPATEEAIAVDLKMSYRTFRRRKEKAVALLDRILARHTDRITS
jgi:hypothetical protein